MSRYRTTPDEVSGMPPGVPYIVSNEVAERFSYYGMRTILVVFMTKYLMSANGASDTMVEIFGDAGKHARSAVGVAALPLGVAVEIDGIFEVA